LNLEEMQERLDELEEPPIAASEQPPGSRDSDGEQRRAMQ